MRKQNFFLLLMSLVVIVSCTTMSKNQKENNFVRVENGQFIRNGKPYYYIGTNFWYGAILGSEGEGGNQYT
jgi:mannan endo-1,4-beta-mannosidase